MYWEVVEVQIAEPWTLAVRFADGLKGRVVFHPSFFEGVFAPLQSLEQFSQVFIDAGAVAWPGDLDLAPDALHRQLQSTGEYILKGTGVAA